MTLFKLSIFEALDYSSDFTDCRFCSILFLDAWRVSQFFESSSYL